jgi:hypothetical protein
MSHRLTASEALFECFDAALSAVGFLAMSGQIIDASTVAAPKQRNTDGEKRDIKAGRIPHNRRQSQPSVRQIVAGLQNQRFEHQHVIK